MRTIFVLAAIAILIIGFSSCQKVIEVNLNDTMQKTVIEGEVNDGPGPYNVRVSYTKNFSENNTFPGVDGCTVYIQDSTTGTTDTLTNTTNGNYLTNTLKGIPGHTYLLTVKLNGIAQNVYTASSAMPVQAVGLDTLYAQRAIIGDDTFMTPVFRDPAGVGNNYRIRQWINGKEIKGSSVRNDEVRDGTLYNSSIRYDNSEESGNPRIHAGDSLALELQCLNRQVYDYYRTLRDVTGTNSATPANPLTNVQGGALGIFNACTSRKKAIKYQ